MFFSDLHVQLLARGILNPGEQLVGQTVTSYNPWWAFGFIRRQYLVLATDQRLILVDHRFSFLQPVVQRLHQVDSITWANVQELKVKGLINKKLRVRGVGDHGPVSLTMKIPNTLFGLLAPMKNNLPGARNVVAAFQAVAPAMPQLSPAMAPTHLAPPQMVAPSMAPQYAPPPAPQQFAPPAPHFAAPSMPPINAPGYASVPPPPPPAGAYSAPPSPPFVQPRNAPPRVWS